MFENFIYDSNVSNSKKKHKQLEKLLETYKELNVLTELKSQGKLTYGNGNVPKSLSDRNQIHDIIRRSISRKRLPEDTFEEWHKNPNLNVLLNRQTKGANQKSDVGDIANEVNEVKNSAEHGNYTSGDHDTTESSDSVECNSRSAIQDFLKRFELSDNWVKASYLVKTSGLEVLPHGFDRSSSTFASKGMYSIRRHHLKNLKVLLHINILRKRWTAAYKIFCMLIRFPNVDIRSIWPLGIEILSRKREEGAYSSDDQASFKDEKFLNWLSSFYSINKHYNSISMNSRKFSAPVWRLGSKTHSPLYLITSLWTLLVKNKYSALGDKLEELLLEPPYNVDGTFYFLMALCKLLETIELVNKFLRANETNELRTSETDGDSYNGNEIINLPKEHIQERIQSSIKKIIENLNKCKELSFVFPENVFEVEIKKIIRIVGDVNLEEVLEVSEKWNKQKVDDADLFSPIFADEFDDRSKTYINYNLNEDNEKEITEGATTSVQSNDIESE